MLRIIYIPVIFLLLISSIACGGTTAYNPFPTLPPVEDSTLPPHWATNYYSFQPHDGANHVGTKESIRVRFDSWGMYGSEERSDFLPHEIKLYSYGFGWNVVRIDPVPISPYEWRIDPASGELSEDTKYRVRVITRNGWQYSSTFWTGSNSSGIWW